MKEGGASRAYRIQRWSQHARRDEEDIISIEEPLEIRVDGEAVAVTMRTPGHDEDLAAGFCLTEAIVSDPDDIARVEPCNRSTDDNIIDVITAGDKPDAVARARRTSFVASSCGICGKQSLDRIEQQAAPFETGTPTISQSIVAMLPESMRRQQTEFSRTGGLHSAALFNRDGHLIALREDIGRHNAVDKIIGHCLLQRRKLAQDTILLVSGRTSFEIVQKAAMGRIPIVAAISAPSSLAIDLAERLQMTLIGFLRDDQFNTYSGTDRITAAAAANRSSN